MLANVLVSISGTLVFLFLFWKRLKEDYVAGIVFKVAFYVLVGVLVGFLLAFKFFPGWFLWTSFVGALLGMTIGILTLKVRFYETLEALIISFLPWLAFMFLGNSVVKSSLSSFLAFVATLILVFVSYWFDVHYKEFTWYKSGKVGFAGLATLALIFLVRSTVAIFGSGVLSFVNQKYEAMISAAFAFVCFLLIFNLGRQE